MGIAANFFAGGGVHDIQSEPLSKEESKDDQIDMGIAQAFFAGGGVTEIYNDSPED